MTLSHTRQDDVEDENAKRVEDRVSELQIMAAIGQA
jgi:hypothetical protein